MKNRSGDGVNLFLNGKSCLNVRYTHVSKINVCRKLCVCACFQL